MVNFQIWCNYAVSSVNGGHYLGIYTFDPARYAIGVNTTANFLPEHYIDKKSITRILKNLGKVAAAKVLEDKIPQSVSLRSGDIGEIYATEWIDSSSGGYKAPIKRLRWRDHREMAMRGDDVIGIFQDSDNKILKFIKTEAKSRIALDSATLKEAREGLDGHSGLPSPHALSYIAERLYEIGNEDLADSIYEVQLIKGLFPNQVHHLTFVFTGNAPASLLAKAANEYSGTFTQWMIGIHAGNHKTFINEVFLKVAENAQKP